MPPPASSLHATGQVATTTAAPQAPDVWAAVAEVPPVPTFHDPEVSRLLEGLQLAEFLPSFVAHEIDMETLMELTEEELAKLGLDRLGPRNKLFSHIQHLKLAFPRVLSTRDRDAEARAIDFADLKLGKTLAQGRTGEVFEGRLRNHTSVVIRRLNKNVNQTIFLNEAKLFSLVSSHPHVVAFMGVAKDADHLYLVYERVPDGTLRDYLQSRKKKLPLHTLIDLTKDVAAGMDHLHQHGIVHRNLTAGNLVLERLRSYNIVKVCDAGLLKALEAAGHYQQASARWLSPEAIAWQKFTPKSDSWSFGVVMWEIFSGGKLPFSEHGDDDEERVEEMIGRVPLACPAGCPEEVFRIMESCWAADPDQRPTMYDLGNKLADLDYGRDGDGPDSEDDSSDSSDGESAESDDGATSTTSDEVYSSDGSGSQAVYASLRDSR